jgi:isopentenyl diphosphate isomerase/L-lactate dehydrogenase-like FMN-dependent dehydrogenase
MVHRPALGQDYRVHGPIDCGVQGTKWEEEIPFPVAVAPVGVLRIFNLDGEMAAAKKVPYILSRASSTSIEDVAKANGEGGMRWYQPYRPSREHDDITISLLQRAKKAGYTVLFVTLDTGYNCHDLPYRVSTDESHRM